MKGMTSGSHKPTQSLTVPNQLLHTCEWFSVVSRGQKRVERYGVELQLEGAEMRV
jgi:hypothetical protein